MSVARHSAADLPREEVAAGEDLHQLMSALFPFCRSITGDGVRKTLATIGELIPLQLSEVPTGTQVFDWQVPREWNIRDAYIENEEGRRVVDFRRCNLHVMGYSAPVDRWMSLDEMQEHLHSLEDQPDAIPYVTSYYQERWGFCLSHRDREQLTEGRYHVVIDSDFKDGCLTYGECIIPGESEEEVFCSTYVCHPSMANNELSGPVVLTYISKWLMSVSRRYTYRLIFIPETIGALTYLSRHLDVLKERVVAGFNLSCLGDDRMYSCVASPYGDTLADRIAQNVLRYSCEPHKLYPFLDRGSDERQYCSPRVSLPLVTLCRSKYGTYPEYHTSLDDLDLVSARGLEGGYGYVKRCIEVAEANAVYRVTCCGEPQLGRRGLYPTLSTKNSGASVETMMDLLAYADGNNDVVSISNLIGKPVWELDKIARRLESAGLLEVMDVGSQGGSSGRESRQDGQ